MRRFDKKLNIQNANLLAEQRYLNSKSVITESYGELGDDFFKKYNTSADRQKEICWNMVQHYGFENAYKKNKELLQNAYKNGGDDEAKLMQFRLNYMDDNMELLNSPNNPFFKK